MKRSSIIFICSVLIPAMALVGCKSSFRYADDIENIINDETPVFPWELEQEFTYTESDDSDDSGYISYNGQDVRSLGVEFREKLGYMPQYPGMYPNYTVEKFLWYMATLKSIDKSTAAAQIKEVLEAVELSDVSNRRISALSGGMKQRLALAQAVLGDPEILILDEPTAGLDPKQRISVRNYISKIALNKIVIIATHVVSDVEYISKAVIFLKKGVITDFASSKELASKIEGKVWEISCDSNDLTSLQQQYRVINIAGGGDELVLRVLSESTPIGNSRTATPTLEDYYLWVFGENSSEAN